MKITNGHFFDFENTEDYTKLSFNSLKLQQLNKDKIQSIHNRLISLYLNSVYFVILDSYIRKSKFKK